MSKLGNLYIIIILMFLVVIASYSFYHHDDYTKYDYEVIYCDELDEKMKVKLYCLNDKNEIKAIEVEVLNEDDLALEIFNFYNEYQNSLPTNYYSPLNGVVSISEFKVDSETLTISIDKLPMDCNVQKFFECLKETYKLLGIKKIIITSGLSQFVLTSFA